MHLHAKEITGQNHTFDVPEKWTFKHLMKIQKREIYSFELNNQNKTHIILFHASKVNTKKAFDERVKQVTEDVKGTLKKVHKIEHGKYKGVVVQYDYDKAKNTYKHTVHLWDGDTTWTATIKDGPKDTLLVVKTIFENMKEIKKN